MQSYSNGTKITKTVESEKLLLKSIYDSNKRLIKKHFTSKSAENEQTKCWTTIRYSDMTTVIYNNDDDDKMDKDDGHKMQRKTRTIFGRQNWSAYSAEKRLPA